MKIGWIKFTMSLEFDYNTAHANAGHERGPIARNLVKRGHTLHVYTPLARNEIKTLEKIKKTGEQTGEWDNSFMQEISYEPEGLPNGLDVLIVENAALNFQFADKTGKPQIRRTAEIIDAHKGLVIYVQGDPDLPFPFHKMAGCDKDWNHPDNPYRLGKKDANLEEYGWATYDEIFKDKTWVMAVRSKEFEQILDACEASRIRMRGFVDKGLVHLRYMYCPQPNEYFNEFEVKENPRYDIISIGYPKHREKDFEKMFLFVVNYYNLVATGNWDRGKNQEYRDMCTKLGMECLGFVDGYKNLYSVINDCVCNLHLGVGKTKKLSWVTGRWSEAIFSKTLTLYDDRISVHKEDLGPCFGINKDNAYNKFKAVMRLTYPERKKLWAWQYDQVKRLNVSGYCDLLEQFCEEFNVKVARDKKLQKKYANVWDETEQQSGVEYDENEIANIIAGFDKVYKPSTKDIKLLKELRKTEEEILLRPDVEDEDETPLETFVREELENKTMMFCREDGNLVEEEFRNTDGKDLIRKSLDIMEKIVSILQKTYC